VPVQVSYLCESGCRPIRGGRRHNDPNKKKREYFEKYDLGKIGEIEAKEILHWYPKNRMMNTPEDQVCWGVMWRKGVHEGIENVCDFFTKRNLYALAILRLSINSRDHSMMALSSIILNSSLLYRNRKGGGGGPAGNLYVAPINREMAVWPQFKDKIKDYFNCSETNDTRILISTDTATRLPNIINNSIDYIFTDPPYAEKVQYGEMNFIWESWLGFDLSWHDEEIIISSVRGKTEEDWANMMRQAMAECYRVLKPGRCISLCYHDTSEGTWSLVQDIMAEAGFVVDKSDAALYIDTGQKSYNQQTADKVNKRDLVINFHKPKPGEVIATIAITENEDETTFNEKVHIIIRDYIGTHPGASKDRIYDEVVSRMVRRGQMEAHNFNELLGQVAEEAKVQGEKNQGGRWYLKENELTVADAAENARENTAAEEIGEFIKGRLKKHLGDEGIHYSDLFENYIHTVKDKPRRQLAEFLPDYFYKTSQGTWRLPASEEEDRAKREARTKGLGRRVKRYIAQVEQGVAIPDHDRPSDTTMAEWIRHCKRAGLYEQGKLIYEKGGLNLDNLTEEALVNAEEDYQVCVRMLSRITDKTTPQRKRDK